jgi:hypothetical protein
MVDDLTVTMAKDLIQRHGRLLEERWRTSKHAYADRVTVVLTEHDPTAHKIREALKIDVKPGEVGFLVTSLKWFRDDFFKWFTQSCFQNPEQQYQDFVRNCANLEASCSTAEFVADITTIRLRQEEEEVVAEAEIEYTEVREKTLVFIGGEVLFFGVLWRTDGNIT